MNTSHYPSLELCKKLTEIGFPETEKVFAKLVQFKKDDPEHGISDKYQDMLGECIWDYVCPSVMEMLDVMPQSITEGVLQISHDCHDDGSGDLYWAVEYSAGQSGNFPMESCDDDKGGLPNALAEMILWLHENNYISFNK